MQKTTKEEWTAVCRDCAWCGSRSHDRTVAQQYVNKHLKTHPQHNVRLMVTGHDSAAKDEAERIRVEKVWEDIDKRKKPSKVRVEPS